jgi:RNase H-fold protein (predicted Holliday junction resolvase)
MSENATEIQLRTAVVSVDYPADLRSSDTREASFWTGTMDERTFFVLEHGAESYLVAPRSDPRSAGWWGQGNAYLPADHLNWVIDPTFLTFIDEDDKAPAPSTFEDLLEDDEDEADDVDGPTWAELKAENERLKERVQRQEEEYSESVEARRQAYMAHEKDIALIGSTLTEEAESREWCGEYDQIIIGLNNQLNIPLPPRQKEYEVFVNVTYRVMVEVTAKDEEEAGDKALESSFEIDQFQSPENSEVDRVQEA